MRGTGYRAAEAIKALPRFSGTPGLHRIRALMAALGNPQDGLRFVHVAGTNGKGSTAAMTAEIVRQAGYRVGLFTSPYLMRFHERIQVSGVPITDEALTRLFARVRKTVDALTLPAGESIGQFEFVLAVGMLYFAEQGCDLVVLETGLGGAFDASNVIAPPLAAVITSISLDHTAALGNTPEAIARTKAGIIKPGSRVVCARGLEPGAAAVIAAACEKAGVPLVVPGAPQILQSGLEGSVFSYEGQTYPVGMAGAHQVENALCALEAARLLAGQGFAVTDAHIEAGLRSARLPGRLELVGKNPAILLDGAHNPGGARALRAAVDTWMKKGRLLLVMGMVADKAVEAVAGLLAAQAETVFAVQPDSDRALAAGKLADIVRETCPDVRVCGRAEAGIAAALEEAGADDWIVVCGSLYLAGEAKIILSEGQKPTR